MKSNPILWANSSWEIIHLENVKGAGRPLFHSEEGSLAPPETFPQAMPVMTCISLHEVIRPVLFRVWKQRECNGHHASTHVCPHSSAFSMMLLYQPYSVTRGPAATPMPEWLCSWKPLQRPFSSRHENYSSTHIETPRLPCPTHYPYNNTVGLSPILGVSARLVLP